MLKIEIKRDRARSYEPEDQEEIIFYIEVDPVISRGSLIAKSLEKDESKIIEETSIRTPNFDPKNRSSKYSLSDSQNFEGNTLYQVLSGLIEATLSKSGIKPNAIDKISGYSNTFCGLENPTDEASSINELLDRCEKIIGKNIEKMEIIDSKISANEIKSKMVARGGSIISRMEGASREGPNCYIDLSTSLSGISFENQTQNRVNGLLVGIGSRILDALASGHGNINKNRGNTLDLNYGKGRIYEKEVKKFTSRTLYLIQVQRVSSGKKQVGGIPIDVEESYDQDTKLIGCEIVRGKDGIEKIRKIGQEAASYGSKTLEETIDKVFARVLVKLIKKLYEEQLISKDSNLFISGREVFSRDRPENLIKSLKKSGYERISKNIYFLENPASFGVDFAANEN